jgi:hypothetical protein
MQNVWFKCFAALCWLVLASVEATAQSFSDMFATRQLVTNFPALITGANTNATLEPGEPRYAGKIGGHSVWISWFASANGLVTLSTTGSTFDTLLAVYTLPAGTNQFLRQLREVVSNDDYGGLKTSYLQFGASANHVYQIAVDGFDGDSGDIALQFGFLASSNLQPIVVQRPGDQALRLGDPLILSMGLVPSPNLQFKWYLNGQPVFNQESDEDSTDPTLIIPMLQRTNLGFYSLKFYFNDISFFSSAIEIQVNSEGLHDVLARNKIADAALSGLAINNTITGVMLGYAGTQIFNTTYAVVDTNAPAICGVPPGPAYWFSYQAPTNGLMTIDTTNSAFATLLAVFTCTGPLTSFTNLVSVACDNNASGTGTNSSQVQFVTTAGSTYYIVVGGVNGARGLAHLNYSLTTGLPPAPPVLTSQPQSLVVVTQTAVAFSVVASGAAPLVYQWWKDHVRLKAETNASLLLRAPKIQDSGDYTVVVTNLSGMVTSPPANVTVISSPLTTLTPDSNWLVCAFPGIRNYLYTADCATSLAPGDWWPWTNAYPDYGGVVWLTNSTSDYPQMFLRIHSP